MEFTNLNISNSCIGCCLTLNEHIGVLLGLKLFSFFITGSLLKKLYFILSDFALFEFSHARGYKTETTEICVYGYAFAGIDFGSITFTQEPYFLPFHCKNVLEKS